MAPRRAADLTCRKRLRMIREVGVAPEVALAMATRVRPPAWGGANPIPFAKAIDMVYAIRWPVRCMAGTAGLWRPNSAFLNVTSVQAFHCRHRHKPDTQTVLRGGVRFHRRL
jgi:hypothetical protein